MKLSISKLICTVILSFGSLSCLGQMKPILYGGVDYFRNKDFTSNAYIDINAGVQLFHWHVLAPEIGYGYYFGLVRDQNEIHPEDPNARAPSKLKTRFSSHIFTFAPKIKIGDEEAALVFIPQYNLGSISARGDLLKDSGTTYVLVEQQKADQPVSFWSFAAGVEGQFYESDVLHFGLFLKYDLLDTRSVLSQLDYEGTSLNSTGGSADALGISFRVYYDLFTQL